jgi:hypothetical protein
MLLGDIMSIKNDLDEYIKIKKKSRELKEKEIELKMRLTYHSNDKILNEIKNLLFDLNYDAYYKFYLVSRELSISLKEVLKTTGTLKLKIDDFMEITIDGFKIIISYGNLQKGNILTFINKLRQIGIKKFNTKPALCSIRSEFTAVSERMEMVDIFIEEMNKETL